MDTSKLIEFFMSNCKYNITFAFEFCKINNIDIPIEVIDLFKCCNINYYTASQHDLIDFLSMDTLYMAYGLMKNIPKIVAKSNFKHYNFYFSSIETLENLPSVIQGNLWVNRTNLITLKGCPHAIGGDLDISNTPLTNLNYIANDIKGTLYMSNTKCNYSVIQLKQMVKANTITTSTSIYGGSGRGNKNINKNLSTWKWNNKNSGI